MRNQDEFKKNKQDRGTIRTTRILANHRRSLRQLQTNNHRSMVPDPGWFDGD